MVSGQTRLYGFRAVKTRQSQGKKHQTVSGQKRADGRGEDQTISRQAVRVLPEEPVDVLVLGPCGADDALLVRRCVRHHDLCRDKVAGGQLSARRTFLKFNGIKVLLDQ